MVRTTTPELKKYMDRKLFLQLNGNRTVTGVLRGFDPFMNLVLDEAVDQSNEQQLGMIVIRGNSIAVMQVIA